VYFEVENNTLGPVDLYWCDRYGAEVYYATVKAGTSMRQRSFLGHAWAVRDNEDGEVLTVAVLKAPKEKIIVAAAGAAGGRSGHVGGSSGTQRTCCCCHEVHDHLKGEERVDSYLVVGGSHMLTADSETWICEFCCRWICSACGKEDSTTDALVGQWSIPNLRCSTCIAANKTGNWEWKRDVLHAKGDDMTCIHCSTCRQKLLQKNLFDRANGSGHVGGSPGTQQCTCYCCHEVHDHLKGDQRVDSYLMVDGSHMLTADSERWICEFCSRWICSACGKKGSTSEGRVGQWSVPNLRCDACVAAKMTGNWAWKRDVLHATGDDMTRIHCSTCRQKLLQKNLVDRALVGGESSSGAVKNRASVGGKVAEAVTGELSSVSGGTAGTRCCSWGWVYHHVTT